jgi:hypothetical protein
MVMQATGANEEQAQKMLDETGSVRKAVEAYNSIKS